jgi:hypothetical protein
MSMRTLVVSLWLVVTTLACEPAPVVATEADEPAIWSAALAHQRNADLEATPFLVNETADALIAPFDVDDLAAQLPDVDAATLTSFDARAQAAAPLNVESAGYTVIAPDDAPVATPEAPVVSLSRAGFGPDEAIVYIEVFCGTVCANGRLFVVERDGDGTWSVTTTFDLWQS